MILHFLGQRYETHTFETEIDLPLSAEIKAIGKYRGIPTAIPATRTLGVAPAKSVKLVYRGVNYSR